MRKSRLLKFTLLLMTLFILFNSCTQRSEVYRAKYPEHLTPEYCYENYVSGDPNLSYLIAAENNIGKLEINASVYTFSAVKDLPVDKYICCMVATFMAGAFDFEILKNKDNSEEAILDFEAESVELIWRDHSKYSDNEAFTWFGTDVVHQAVASFDAKEFQSYLLETVSKIQSGDIEEVSSGLPLITTHSNNKQDSLNLAIRVHFAKYENLVWDALIQYDEKDYYDGKYYMWIYLHKVSDILPEGYYDQHFVAVPDEFESFIDEAINNKEQ